MDVAVKKLAAQIRAIQQAQSDKKMTRYPQKIQDRAARVFKEGSFTNINEFAAEIGVSSSGLRKWLEQYGDTGDGMLPVEVIGSSRGKNKGTHQVSALIYEVRLKFDGGISNDGLANVMSTLNELCHANRY